jgi:hypothetical protein
MDFTFNEDQQAILAAVREFCDEELAPKARETDEAGAWPAENVRKMAELDLMGIPVPEEYGGLGMDFLTWSAVGEELSRACTTTGAVYGAHALALVPIMQFGTEEQKRKYLVPLAKGEHIGAFGLTEPGAGSDAGAVATKAVRDGDHYVLNGTKIFISNGGEAQTYVIITSTDPSRGATLELALTKVKSSKYSPQILGLSAVLKDPDRLASWLGCQLLVEKSRPVELLQGVLLNGEFHFRKHNSGEEGDQNLVQMESEESHHILFANLKKLLDEREQILVFLKSKKCPAPGYGTTF